MQRARIIRRFTLPPPELFGTRIHRHELERRLPAHARMDAGTGLPGPRSAPASYASGSLAHREVQPVAEHRAVRSGEAGVATPPLDVDVHAGVLQRRLRVAAEGARGEGVEIDREHARAVDAARAPAGVDARGAPDRARDAQRAALEGERSLAVETVEQDP